MRPGKSALPGQERSSQLLDVLQILLGTLAFLVPLLIGQRLGLLRYASPLHFVAYFAFFGFTIKAITYTFLPEMAFYNRWIISESQVGWGYAYTSAFIFLLCIGYIFATRPSERANIGRNRMVFQNSLSPEILFMVAAATTILTTAVYLYARGGVQADDAEVLDVLQELNAQKIQRSESDDGIGRSFGIIKIFYLIPGVIMCLLLAQYMMKRNARVLLYLILSAALYLGATILHGGRSDLMDLFIFALVTAALLGIRINGSSVLIGALTLPVVLIVFSFMTVLRMTRGDIDQAQLISTEPLEQIVGSTYFLDINAPIMISAMIRPDQMLWGTSYLYWTYAWIPRFLWPEKPAVDIGPYLKNEIMRVDIAGLGGYNPTGAGEAYINFGPWGVLFAFVIGYAMRRGEVFLLSDWSTKKVYGPVIYATIFIGLIQGVLQSSFSGHLVSSAAQAVIVFLTCKLVLKEQKQRQPQLRPRLRRHI